MQNIKTLGFQLFNDGPTPDAMLEKFSDRRKVLRTLRAWPAASKCNDSIINQLADAGELISFKAGEKIIINGDPSDDAFVLLHGEAKVQLAKKSETRLRKAPVSIGEMSYRSHGAGRCADVSAVTNIVALKFQGEDFDRIVRSCSQLDLGLQHDLENRTRQSAQSNPSKPKSWGFYAVVAAAGCAVALATYFGSELNFAICASIGAVTIFMGLFFNPDHWMKRVTGIALLGQVVASAVRFNTDAEGGKLDFLWSNTPKNGWDVAMTVCLLIGFLTAAFMERRK